MRTAPAPLVAALAICLAAGPLLLDRCLITCHAETSTSTGGPTPLCHDAGTERPRDSWQATAFCGHDHNISSAESPFKLRAGSPLKNLTAAVVEDRDVATPVRGILATLVDGPPPGAPNTAAFPLPLRV